MRASGRARVQGRCGFFGAAGGGVRLRDLRRVQTFGRSAGNRDFRRPPEVFHGFAISGAWVCECVRSSGADPDEVRAAGSVRSFGKTARMSLCFLIAAMFALSWGHVTICFLLLIFALITA